MSGDTTKAHAWANADVWTGATDAAEPTDISTEPGTGWDLVGLLDGDEGFVQSRDEDTEDLYAWGGVLVRTTRQHFKLTTTFTALENNDVTRALLWPNSPAGKIVVPKPQRIKVIFQLSDPTTNYKHRLITAYQAEVNVEDDITSNEADLTSYPFTVTVFPDASGTLFNVQDGELVTSI